jgi:hypothetical protein
MANQPVKRGSSSAEKDSLSAAKTPIAVTNTSNEDRKTFTIGHVDYHGIDTTQVQPGADAAYEAKITVLNEALIDIGMGPFQWKIFATTGFGWFVDNVSLASRFSTTTKKVLYEILTSRRNSFGCKPSRISSHLSNESLALSVSHSFPCPNTLVCLSVRPSGP